MTVQSLLNRDGDSNTIMSDNDKPLTSTIAENEGKVKRFVHQSVKNTHNGITFEIHQNGKISLSKAGNSIDIPASLVFKLSTLLKATRSTEWVDVSSGKDNPSE